MLLLKQNLKNHMLSEMNFRLLGRQYKIIDLDLHFDSSSLKRKNNFFKIEGVNLFAKHKFETQVICINRGLHE